MKYFFWNRIHNIVAHGLLYGFIGEWSWTDRFHNWTASKMEEHD